jgi:hypothetical protein
MKIAAVAYPIPTYPSGTQETRKIPSKDSRVPRTRFEQSTSRIRIRSVATISESVPTSDEHNGTRTIK